MLATRRALVNRLLSRAGLHFACEESGYMAHAAQVLCVAVRGQSLPWAGCQQIQLEARSSVIY